MTESSNKRFISPMRCSTAADLIDAAINFYNEEPENSDYCRLDPELKYQSINEVHFAACCRAVLHPIAQQIGEDLYQGCKTLEISRIPFEPDEFEWQDSRLDGSENELRHQEARQREPSVCRLTRFDRYFKGEFYSLNACRQDAAWLKQKLYQRKDPQELNLVTDDLEFTDVLMELESLGLEVNGFMSPEGVLHYLHTFLEHRALLKDYQQLLAEYKKQLQADPFALFNPLIEEKSDLGKKIAAHPGSLALIDAACCLELLVHDWRSTDTKYLVRQDDRWDITKLYLSAFLDALHTFVEESQAIQETPLNGGESIAQGSNPQLPDGDDIFTLWMERCLLENITAHPEIPWVLHHVESRDKFYQRSYVIQDGRESANLQKLCDLCTVFNTAKLCNFTAKMLREYLKDVLASIVDNVDDSTSVKKADKVEDCIVSPPLKLSMMKFSDGIVIVKAVPDYEQKSAFDRLDFSLLTPYAWLQRRRAQSLQQGTFCVASATA
ncbi:MAG: hypothetical protein IAB19_09370 [Proteobacteria bacterium]|uniref:Uncharacterized protein n=1 Tax=Candidatus Avisuccinivibrio stercorigallinarum TaxID=2840704 RepID=A0A9D9DEF5_9GAMM|nr:hypothetical protein [Candidatus Avisuccinivibrio stercorigallinarum]